MQPTITRNTLRTKPVQEMSPEELEQAILANEEVLYKDFDEGFARGMVSEIIDNLRVYYRPRFYGLDDISDFNEKGEKVIFASNHSGMAFPWDAIIMGCEMMARNNFDLHKIFRPLASPLLSASRLMNPYMVDNAWRRAGGIDATTLNFETVMRFGRTNALIYPEGVPGIGKGFNRRYQLQTFSSSVVRMSLKYRADVVSIFCINGEHLNPYSYNVPWLNRLVNKIGVPFLFVGILTIPLLLQPWLFYASLPAQLNYVRGKRYRPYEMTNLSWEEMTTEEIKRVRDQLQAEMQAEIDELKVQYGQNPYKWGEFFRNLFKNWRMLPYTTPIGWPVLFLEFERKYRKTGVPPDNITKGWFRFLRACWHHPLMIAYFIPVIGWIPLIIKGISGRKKVKSWSGSHV